MRRRAVGYVRLSQEDERDPGPIAEKLQARAAIVRDLAARNDIHLDDADIHQETGSGRSLAERPIATMLIEMCRSGQVDALITPFQDRLTRGNAAEWEDIKAALTRGRVMLITVDATTDWGDENLDELTSDIKAVMARQELRNYTQRRRQANKVRARQGVRSGGRAPYGYVWVLAQRDPHTREVITPAHYDTEPDEYAVLCEVFRRIVHEGMGAILEDLNTRYRETGHPAPPGATRGHANQRGWGKYQLWRILHNPHYAGYPARRSTIVRGERRRLERDEWILSDTEQDYPHPVTLVQLERIHQLMTDRAISHVRTTSRALLTGVLTCQRGRPMHAHSATAYACKCRLEGTDHPQRAIASGPIEALVTDVLREAVMAWPAADSQPLAQAHDRTQVALELHSAERRLSEARDAVQDLQRHLGAWVRAWGEDGYAESARRAIEQAEQAERTVADLRAALMDPDSDDARTIADAARDIGWDALWTEAGHSERRDILRAFVANVTPLPTARGWAQHVRVTMQPYVAHMPPTTDRHLNAYRFKRE